MFELNKFLLHYLGSRKRFLHRTQNTTIFQWNSNLLFIAHNFECFCFLFSSIRMYVTNIVPWLLLFGETDQSFFFSEWKYLWKKKSNQIRKFFTKYTIHRYISTKEFLVVYKIKRKSTWQMVVCDYIHKLKTNYSIIHFGLFYILCLANAHTRIHWKIGKWTNENKLKLNLINK